MRYFLLIILLLSSHGLFSQADKKDTLREVLIKNRKADIILNTQTIDSNILIQYQNTTLQNVLQLHSNVFVKNYGIGSLSTISIRGSSAAQTAVLWHGMNINNAMTGISDFSILPVSFFDEIKINYSGNNTNALAGHIELRNEKPVFSKCTEVSAGDAYESLQNGAGYASVLQAGKKYSVNVKGFYQQSKNEFTYYNPEKETYEKLIHADSKTKGILSDIYIKVLPDQTLALHLWTQESIREIPPALFEKISTKHETTRSLKAIIDYEVNKNRWSSKTSLGLMKDRLDYTDSLISFSSQAEAITMPLTETFLLQPSSRQKIILQASAICSKLLTGSLENLQRAFVSLHYEVEPKRGKTFIKTYLRKEYTNVFTLPWIAGLHIKQKIYRLNYITASVSSNYRTPTLNELYFTPGGNKNLKPETSRNLEGGIESNALQGSHSLKTNVSLFSRDVKNWIVWYGGSILTPHNIQRVWSRGLEVDMSYKFNISSKNARPELTEDYAAGKSEKGIRYSSFNLHLLYSYTLSTTKESSIANDYSIGKQIPYVPRYQLKLNIGYTKNNFDISYVYAYTGYRFVTTDESEYLLPYNTHNIFTSYILPVKSKHQFLATFKLNNLLNKSYESIIGRVMPGRSFSVGLNYKFRN